MRGKMVGACARVGFTSALVVCSGCGGTPNAGSSGASDASSLDAGSSAAIGPAGGTLRLGGAQLAVPAGALDHEVEIQVSLASGPVPAGYIGYSALYPFEPTG